VFTRDAAGHALFEGARLDALFAGAHGLTTPAYVYSLDAIVAELDALRAGFDGAAHLVAYAVKANSAGPILRALAEHGAGADVVSGGELQVALGAGIGPESIVYSGVGKRDEELDLALTAGGPGILSIQAESVEELGRIAERAARLGRRAPVSLRVNPGVLADTHAHVATGHDEAKFGIAAAELPAAFALSTGSPHLTLVGLASHVGSQLTETTAYLDAATTLLRLAEAHQQALGALQFLDFGGGFGIDYGDGCAACPADFVRALVALVRRSPFADRRILVEPGRCLVGAHGVLCASVLMAKSARAADGEPARRWLMIDAGMNDLLRPALYGARHRIEPMASQPQAEAPRYRVVGPVCESSDDFGEAPFAEPLPRRVVIRDAGAYGFTMASQYNGRALPDEVFLRGGRVVAVLRGATVDAWVSGRLG
jgi:diaminopimelate decarboxylase